MIASLARAFRQKKHSSRLSPPPVVEAMCDDMQQSLGAFGFLWLSACAVYPALHFPLTIQLGQALAQLVGRPPPNEDEHFVLFHLPWFRTGWMPDDLRLALLRRLEPSLRPILRQMIEDLLHCSTGSDHHSDDSLHLKVVLRSWQARALNLAIPHLGEPSSDAVFAHFMLGRLPEARDFDLPHRWARRIQIRSFEWIDGRSILYGSVAILISTLAWSDVGSLIRLYIATSLIAGPTPHADIATEAVFPQRETATAENDAPAPSGVPSRAPEIALVTSLVGANFFRSAVAVGVPTDIASIATHLLSYDVDLQRDLQIGDAFKIAFEKWPNPDGKSTRIGNLIYLELSYGGTRLKFYRYEGDDSDVKYFNEKGESVQKALLRTPIDGADITSGFGMRGHPILGYTKMNRGVDFGAPTGTPIKAAGTGLVEMASFNGAYGLYVRINHGSGYATAYSHMSRIADGIQVGKEVRQGQVIGLVGNTGRATGPVLRYEVLVGGQQVNPLSVKVPSAVSLSGNSRDAFLKRKTEIDSIVASIQSPWLVTIDHGRIPKD